MQKIISCRRINSMKILKSNVENIANEKKLVYQLTKGTSISFKDMTDEELDQSWPVDAFIIYEDDDKKLISILSNKTVLGGQSKPFIDSFEEILEIMEEEPFAIHVQKLTSGKNRTFYKATLDI